MWFARKEASRKYVDLIKEASSKWANWDPPNAIEVRYDICLVSECTQSGIIVHVGWRFRRNQH